MKQKWNKGNWISLGFAVFCGVFGLLAIILLWIGYLMPHLIDS